MFNGGVVLGATSLIRGVVIKYLLVYFVPEAVLENLEPMLQSLTAHPEFQGVFKNGPACPQN